MRIKIKREVKIKKTGRLRQLGAMFDAPVGTTSRMTWEGDFPFDDQPWNVGLIVGPSGCGKSTVAREVFGAEFDKPLAWKAGSVIDDFPKEKSIREIAAVCQAVGFNTIPSWFRPYKVLSTGERFRVELARKLLDSADQRPATRDKRPGCGLRVTSHGSRAVSASPSRVVMDEFTSVVDRQVAKIGSYAVAKYIRKNDRQFVAVSCHYDIIDWLQPDWIFEPGEMKFVRRRLRQRPKLEVTICRVPYSTWNIFKRFHYLTDQLQKSAACYGLFIKVEGPKVEGRRSEVEKSNYQLVGFCGIMRNFGRTGAKICYRISRVVILPDWQGLGLAFVLTERLGGYYKALGYQLRNYPAHPGFIHAHDRSRSWELIRRPGRFDDSEAAKGHKKTVGKGRPCAIFRYSGPAGDLEEARKIVETKIRFKSKV